MSVLHERTKGQTPLHRLVVDGDVGHWTRYTDQFCFSLDKKICASPLNQPSLPEVFEIKSIWATTTGSYDDKEENPFPEPEIT